ncbi:hypothetical protein FRC03_005928 [Tulasnella sp. 419]|nr:hypothetical protein FRC03_005928 [Tulasnella sp. 419]
METHIALSSLHTLYDLNKLHVLSHITNETQWENQTATWKLLMNEAMIKVKEEFYSIYDTLDEDKKENMAPIANISQRPTLYGLVHMGKEKDAAILVTAGTSPLFSAVKPHQVIQYGNDGPYILASRSVVRITLHSVPGRKTLGPWEPLAFIMLMFGTFFRALSGAAYITTKRSSRYFEGVRN